MGSHEALAEHVTDQVRAHYREREGLLGPELFHRLERWIVMGLRWEDGEFRGIDQLWKDHLLNMDHLKEGIGLRGYGQRDPLVEYKKEAFDMFQAMMDNLKETVVEQLFKVRLAREEVAPVQVARAMPAPRWQENRAPNAAGGPLRAGCAQRAPHRHRAQGRAERAMPVRVGEEVQEVLPAQAVELEFTQAGARNADERRAARYWTRNRIGLALAGRVEHGQSCLAGTRQVGSSTRGGA